MEIETIIKITLEEEKKCISEDGKLSPKVAAALIKNNKLIATAYRGELGDGDHAEYTLLEKKLNGKNVSGAILFTTLEPCTSRKTHKSCTEWIIEKGISKVYIGMLDPNPKIYLEGCMKLKAAGISVEYYAQPFREEIKIDNNEFIEQYKANPELEGEATFDYTNNNGNYTVGHQEFIFDLKFGGASNTSIHVYHDNASIEYIADAYDCTNIEEIADATIYDSSSRTRTINKSGIVLFKNRNGFFCAVKILEIHKTSHGGDRNEVSISYRILTKGHDFR